jgi:uncharacterized membrane protein
MEAYLLSWLSLLLRWAHLITGVAWIGASFYFNWLENHLERDDSEGGIEGDLWAIHGGGFYHLKKYSIAPGRLPDTLHWFKWEAYATWLTGFFLLCVVYYWNARTFLIDSAMTGLPEWMAILAGLASLILSWIVYDGLCGSGISGRKAWFSGLLLAWFILLASGLEQLFNGRAAYIHLGAALGTIMVANVFRVIIPSQQDLVKALKDRRDPDARMGQLALQRSRHNNYFTLPVLFIMISSHYPATYGHDNSWLVLLVIAVAGILIRHYFNIRHQRASHRWPLAVAVLLFAGLVTLMAPAPRDIPGARVQATGSAQAFSIVQERCATCHSKQPSNAAFASAPLGIELDTREGLRLNAERVYKATVINRTMPLGNLTQMTEEERESISSWFVNSDHNPANQTGKTTQ